MFTNYIKTAVRSLMRHRFFSAINIFGLAIAMSIGMVVIMLVADQMSYDRYNSRRDRIYRITTAGVNKEGIVTEKKRNATSSMPLRDELLEKYASAEQVVRLKRGFGNNWLELEGQDVNIPLAGFYADPEVFDLFEYTFQYGDPATALKDPYTMVLTRKAANKLFKDENPVGRTLKVGNLGIYTVTGVLKETTRKSHIVFEALASMSTVDLQEKTDPDFDSDNSLTNWPNFWNGWTYALLAPGSTEADLQGNLDKIYTDHIAAIRGADVYKMKFFTQSLNNITPGEITNNSIGPVLPWIFVYFLGGLAVLVLVTSCFNFTNLSIARSLTRVREIGVRKVIGARRRQIFVQFLSESIIVALIAMMIASLLVLILKPLILQLNFARIFRWDLEANTMVFVAFILFAVVVGILAGFFPAIVLSGFQPIKVLKGVTNLKVFSRLGVRKVLLISQFTLSLFFILSVIIMHKQLNLFLTKDYGFNVENNIVVALNDSDPGLLKNELLKYANIENVAAASHIPSAGTSMGNGFKRSFDDEEWTSLGRFSVDADYLNNMKIDLKAGKFFRPEQDSINGNFVVINEDAVKELHFDSPDNAIGQELIAQYDSSRKTIIGVVKDYNHRDLTRAISPMVLMYNPDQFNVVQVRYSGTYENAAKTVEKAWAVVNPDRKIDLKSVETEIEQYYEIVFGDLVKILGVVASLAIFISCLGLLGMAAYTTETRIKEISIRKVLGSSAMSLVLLLSKGFLVVLALAICIGIPATYYLNNLWLELIAYHTTIDLSVFIPGVLTLIAFGVVTIGSQTIRATFVNPVDNLKNE